MPDPQITVLTGDIVASSRLTPGELDAMMAALADAAARAASWPGSGGASAFTRFRGDGWQCLAPTAALALRSALFLRASVRVLGRARDTRVSVGIGSGVRPEGDTLAGATGPAFELSGHGLDSMVHARRFSVAWERPPDDAGLVRVIFDLADEISRNWTQGQAKVFAVLLGKTERQSQEALARARDITQQTVASHLAGGGDWALQEALKALEEGA